MREAIGTRRVALDKQNLSLCVGNFGIDPEPWPFGKWPMSTNLSCACRATRSNLNKHMGTRAVQLYPMILFWSLQIFRSTHYSSTVGCLVGVLSRVSRLKAFWPTNVPSRIFSHRSWLIQYLESFKSDLLHPRVSRIYWLSFLCAPLQCEALVKRLMYEIT